MKTIKIDLKPINDKLKEIWSNLYHLEELIKNNPLTVINSELSSEQKARYDKELAYQPSYESNEDVCEVKHLKLAREVSDILIKDFNSKQQAEFIEAMQRNITDYYQRKIKEHQTHFEQYHKNFDVFIETIGVKK